MNIDSLYKRYLSEQNKLKAQQPAEQSNLKAPQPAKQSKFGTQHQMRYARLAGGPDFVSNTPHRIIERCQRIAKKAQKIGYADALAACRYFIELEPEATEPYFCHAAICLACGEYETCIADCTALIERASAMAEAYCLRAEARYAMCCAEDTNIPFDDEQAAAIIADCTKSIDLKPELLRAQVLRAVTYFRQASYLLCIADCDAVMQHFPGESEILWLLKRLKKLQVEDRLSAWNVHLALLPPFEECALLPVIKVEPNATLLKFAQKKGLDNALACCNVLVKMAEPTVTVHTYYRAVIRQAMEDYEGCLADINAFINAFPSVAEAYVVRANAQYCWHHSKNSNAPFDAELEAAIIADCSRAIEMKPMLMRARILRAKIYYGQKSYAQCAADCEVVAQHFPANSDIALLQRRIENLPVDFDLLTWKKRTDALPPFEYCETPANDLEPNAALLKFAQAKGLDNALKWCSMLVDEDAPAVTVHTYYRAVIKHAMQDYKGCLADINAFIYANPNVAEAYVVRALAAGMNMDKPTAYKRWPRLIDDYSRAIELKPTLRYAYRLRAQLRCRLLYFDDSMADLDVVLAAKYSKDTAAYKAQVRILKKRYERFLAEWETEVENLEAPNADEPQQHVVRSNNIVRIARRMGLEAAYIHCCRIVEAKPEHLMPYYYRAVLSAHLYNSTGSLADYNKVIELDPTMAEAYYLRAETRYMFLRGNLHFMQRRAALDDCAQALALNPMLVCAYRLMGCIKLKAGDSSAANDFSRYLDYIPDDIEAWKLLKRIHVEQKDWSAVVNDYSAMMAKSNSLRFRGERGMAKLELKRYADALADFDWVIVHGFCHPEMYYGRGVARFNLNDANGAMSDFNHIECTTLTFFPPMHFYRALVKLSLNDSSAIDDFSTAIERVPDYAPSYFNRGRLYMAAKQYRKAVNDFNEALRIIPTHLGAYCYRGDALSRMGYTEKALQDFNRALQLDPNNYRIYFFRGMALAEYRDFKGAIRAFSQCINLQPTHYRAYRYRATAKIAINDIAGAIDDYNAVMRIAPEYAEQSKDYFTSLIEDKAYEQNSKL